MAMPFFQVHKPKTLLIEAVFTEQFYQPHGYYDNMKIRTVGLNHSMTPRMIYSGSKTAFDLLSQSFSTTNDIEVTRHPEILQHYDRIILLHNEYVSKVEYDAIIRLPNVFYLYPNALYRYVDYDNKSNTITLVGNTGNPYSLSKWVTSDSVKVNEFDGCLSGYKIVNYPNGKGMNCYPAAVFYLNPSVRNVVLNN